MYTTTIVFDRALRALRVLPIPVPFAIGSSHDGKFWQGLSAHVVNLRCELFPTSLVFAPGAATEVSVDSVLWLRALAVAGLPRDVLKSLLLRVYRRLADALLCYLRSMALSLSNPEVSLP